ncbi:MAG: hypothetical protein J7K81_07475, partial [Methanophagales archaeon]|nr:hypothetical protein [Methanophagales archaeon]
VGRDGFGSKTREKKIGLVIAATNTPEAIDEAIDEAIWSMLDEMNPGLEKLAEEPYEKIKEYELKTRELKDGDFDLNKFKFK